MIAAAPLPLLTADLPGTGGLHKSVPEDFLVEELPLYPRSGEGQHTWLFVEKRGLTTDEAVERLCAALGVSSRDAGVAGQKDRQALTRQWISLPGIDSARALALTIDGLRILEVTRHGHKLRTGHLAGNRFTLTLRGVVPGAVERAQAILAALVERGGLPNYYGAQRFGARGDNAARGRALVVGERLPGRPPSRGERRLLVSAFQSELFNRALAERLREGLLGTVLLGDIVQKRDSGGLFTADEAALPDAAARLAAGAVAVTGPMFGHQMKAPPAGTPVAEREARLLAAEGVTCETFAALGALAEGTRRPYQVPLESAKVRPGDDDDALVIEVTLPPGSYATVLLTELTKPGR
jgi:tRNA pseudouridine13 synthase